MNERRWERELLGRNFQITVLDDLVAGAAVEAAWTRIVDVELNADEGIDSARLAAAATDGWFDIVTQDGTVDLGGMLAGYSCERAAEVLWSWGARNFSVRTPSEFLSRGFADGDQRQWRIPVVDPSQGHFVVSTLSAIDLRVATSGLTGRHARLRVPEDHTATAGFRVVYVTGPDLVWCDVAATALALSGTDGLATWFSDGFVPQGYGAFCIGSDGEHLTAGVRRRIDER